MTPQYNIQMQLPIKAQIKSIIQIYPLGNNTLNHNKLTL